MREHQGIGYFQRFFGGIWEGYRIVRGTWDQWGLVGIWVGDEGFGEIRVSGIWEGLVEFGRDIEY